jgi:hypothetical protein
MKRSVSLIAAVGLTLCAAAGVRAQQTYTVVDLGPMHPRSINKHAQIAGQYLGPTDSRAARWDAQTGFTFLPETFTQNVNGVPSDFSIYFPVDSGGMSDAIGINNLGDIVGLGRVNVTGTWFHNLTRTYLVPHAYHWGTAAIPVTGDDLGVLAPGGSPQSQIGGYSGGPFISLAAAINDSGEVAGSSNAMVGGSVTNHACVWSGGVLQDIDPDGVESYAAALNNPLKDQNGNIVRPTQVVGLRYGSDANGRYAFMYSNGSLIDLSPLGGLYSEARAINDQSQVAGSMDIGSIDPVTGLSSIWQSFRWQDLNGDNVADPSEMKVMTTPAGFDGNYVLGMNNAGQVVGAIYDSPDGFQHDHAALWDPDTGTVVDLNDRIDPALGIFLEDANAINDNGEIICETYYYGTTGETHAYLLKPIASATPKGDTVTVTPSAALPVSLTFPTIASPGDTTVTTSTTGPTLPAGFALSGTFIDIHTTATFSGLVDVSIPYDPVQFPYDPDTNPTGAKPSLLHYEGGQWKDITTAINVQNHLVCGQTQSFSPFAVAIAQPVPADTTAPVITTPGDQAVIATSATGTPVTFTASALDNVDGPVTVTCSPASGSPFPLGASTVTCSAIDAAGNPATASFTVTVTCAWSGILQPINSDGSSVFKLGSTVPVKFQLTGASTGINNLSAHLSYAQISGSDPGAVNEADSTSAATSGNLFRYDATSGQYLFNWSTKGLTKGKYRLYVDLGDGVSHTVDVGLR